jgi:hypothetical protein
MTYSVQNDILMCTIIFFQTQRHAHIWSLHVIIFSLLTRNYATSREKIFVLELTVTQITKLFLSFCEDWKLRYRTIKIPLLELTLKNTHLILNYKSFLKVPFNIIFTANHSSRKWCFLLRIYDWKLMPFLCLRHVLHTAPIILFNLISVCLFLSLDLDHR